MSDGRTPFPPYARARVRRTHWADLTNRETQVLAQLCAGMSNKQIALALDIDEQTVKFHATSLFKKIGVVNRVAAVNHAYRHHIVGCPCGDGGTHQVFVNGNRYVRDHDGVA